MATNDVATLVREMFALELEVEELQDQREILRALVEGYAKSFCAANAVLLQLEPLVRELFQATNSRGQHERCAAALRAFEELRNVDGVEDGPEPQRCLEGAGDVDQPEMADGRDCRPAGGAGAPGGEPSGQDCGQDRAASGCWVPAEWTPWGGEVLPDNTPVKVIEGGLYWLRPLTVVEKTQQK